MSWDFKTNKIKYSSKNDLMCTIDEIVESEELQRISKKYNLSLPLLHKFVTNFVIKVYVEKKMKEEEIIEKFGEIPLEARLAIVEQIKKEAKSRGITS